MTNPDGLLDRRARELLDGRTMAVLGTLRPDGSPQTSVIWVLLPDPGRELPRRLSRKYLGTDPPEAEPGEERLVIRVTPERVVRFAPPEPEIDENRSVTA